MHLCPLPRGHRTAHHPSKPNNATSFFSLQSSLTKEPMKEMGLSLFHPRGLLIQHTNAKVQAIVPVRGRTALARIRVERLYRKGKRTNREQEGGRLLRVLKLRAVTRKERQITWESGEVPSLREERQRHDTGIHGRRTHKLSKALRAPSGEQWSAFARLSIAEGPL